LGSRIQIRILDPPTTQHSSTTVDPVFLVGPKNKDWIHRASSPLHMLQMISLFKYKQYKIKEFANLFLKEYIFLFQ